MKRIASLGLASILGFASCDMGEKEPVEQSSPKTTRYVVGIVTDMRVDTSQNTNGGTTYHLLVEGEDDYVRRYALSDTDKPYVFSTGKTPFIYLNSLTVGSSVSLPPKLPISHSGRCKKEQL